MAKLGFKVIDSDIHVVEPKDLWLRYLEPKFVNDGPRPAEPARGCGKSATGRFRFERIFQGARKTSSSRPTGRTGILPIRRR
jgi:hypothetical protein